MSRRTRLSKLLTPSARSTLPSPPVAPIIDPALTIDDVCVVRNESRRTGERERSAGLWPSPDFYVGTGSRRSPRWLPLTIRRWVEGVGK